MNGERLPMELWKKGPPASKEENKKPHEWVDVPPPPLPFGEV